MSMLSRNELVNLIGSVFPPLEQDKALGILVDIPNHTHDDTPLWADRRRTAQEWADLLKAAVSELGLESIHLFAYAAVGSNNADLPQHAYDLDVLPDTAESLGDGKVEFARVFQACQIFLAPTQLSTTAPLKVAAKTYHFRAATMPGFSKKLVPALRIDYELVSRRCTLMKEKLDVADTAFVRFAANGETYEMEFDLRYRPAHASSGRFPLAGTDGNLPSGETYIVPYEGEKDEPSRTHGVLPVQFEDEVVLFQIRDNTAVKVTSEGRQSRKQQEWLQREPAYGNMAELGFGVLGDFGLEPTGEVLLDEKLGFHIAFGRSDHFGGITGPQKFSAPSAVVHIDYIYTPEMQPKVSVEELSISMDGKQELIIQNGAYQVF